MENFLPSIPAKRYFTIGEVSDLCGVKPHVLRYWEQEFTQLRPMKRRGNRRYYQHHEVLMIRKIRDLLYDQGFTITGARNKLHDLDAALQETAVSAETLVKDINLSVALPSGASVQIASVETLEKAAEKTLKHGSEPLEDRLQFVRRQLHEIRDLLKPSS